MTVDTVSVFMGGMLVGSIVMMIIRESRRKLRTYRVSNGSGVATHVAEDVTIEESVGQSYLNFTVGGITTTLRHWSGQMVTSEEGGNEGR
jgi:hypothetical protein